MKESRVAIREFLQGWKLAWIDECQKAAQESVNCDVERYEYDHSKWYDEWNAMCPDGVDKQHWEDRGLLFGLELRMDSKHHIFAIEKAKCEVERRSLLMIEYMTKIDNRITYFENMEMEDGRSNV